MLWLFSLFALAASAQPVATISIGDFTSGRSWVWEYRTERGDLYSTEKYSVVSVNGNQVVLEMSTTFFNEGHFQSHHRLVVPLDRCLAAYANPSEVKVWSFKMFFREGEHWREVVPPSTLAFEEKFNCNPYRHDSLEFKTEFKSSPVGELFTHKRWRTLEGTWFMNEGELRGVAFAKKFTHGNGGETYHLSLSKSESLAAVSGI